jgi:cephalosporin-C deacetylase-like acetyl esterase
MRRIPILATCVLALIFLFACAGRADDLPPAAELAQKLRKLDVNVWPKDSEPAKEAASMLSRDIRSRLRAAGMRETEAWQRIGTREEWEKYKAPRLEALRRSLGTFPEAPKDLALLVTRTIGDGYRIRNVAFESRPGLVVTANLYEPARQPDKPMPGFLVVHSHHNPKTQGELQDMGITWAKAGCTVLVMDQLGHGERRQHPFINASSYPGKFQPSRQDYHFRYNEAMQLHLVGESLVGWMAWDLMRGVDLLLKQPGVDGKRIVLLGSVAGGGDPCAVTAALDPRITCAVPFNFGGPQPETTFPLPADENAFNYTGGGSWESTRNLRLSARDGFLPWVIVGSVFPRYLIYAHEFAWDRDRDPVWKRLEKIQKLYGVEHLSETHGRGAVTGKPPEATHCNNIGSEHRKAIHPALKEWFGLPVPEKDVFPHHPPEDLICLTAEAGRTLKPKPLHALCDALAVERGALSRKERESLPAAERRAKLREEWTRVLGDVKPRGEAAVKQRETGKLDGISIERLVLEVEPGILVPTTLLVPPHKDGDRLPVVVGLCQEGKQTFLTKNSSGIADLLHGGVAVCLPDVRGTGETRPGDGRGRQSSATSLSSSELMLGQTMLGSRLRDLQSVLAWLRQRKDVDGGRIALWGASFAPANPADRRLDVPWDAEKLPDQAEPLGGLLALLGGLFDERIRAICAQDTLISFRSVLADRFCYIPHDIVVPGVLATGDLVDVAAVLAPRALRLEELVDGRNRSVERAELEKEYAPAVAAYRGGPLELHAGDRKPVQQAWEWLRTQLK